VRGEQTCEGLCSPSACANPGNVCVDNLCALPCAAEIDCPIGQSCVPAVTDGTSMPIAICQINGKSAIGLKCPLGNECAAQQPSCPDGSNCDYTQCGGDTCSPDPIACGDAGTCAIGRCADSTPCTVPGCTSDQCQPLVCLSSGAGDADAYCTMLDCQTDDNCGGGFWCAIARDPHPICGAAAGKLPGLCAISCVSNAACVTAYGTGSVCTTGFCQPPCVMTGGATTFKQGSFCTERNECRVRRACDPCTTDLDCSAVAGQHCTAMPPPNDSAKFCSVDCSTDADCPSSFGCTGNECVPRYGTCTGTGAFCEPCHSDDECGAGRYCSREETGGERICTAPIGGTPCSTDANCPTSPSGQHGACMDTAENSAPGDGVYHTCWLPYNTATARFACWPANTGSPCYKSTECVSPAVCKGANAATLTPGTCQ